MIELSKRLSRVASYIDKGVVLADIGSDHAYIPCYSVLNAMVDKAYACEVVDGPLQCSIKTIKEYGLDEKVFPVLSDGLKSIPDDVNEIVIAGMGAYTILDILKASEVKVERCVKCIIQTNSHPELIRTYLSEKNYRILNEELIEEEGKYYDIIIFEPRNGTTLSDVEIYFGPCHLKEKSTLLISYYQKVLETKYKILENLNSSNAKYLSLKEEIEMIKKELQL